MYVVIEIQRNVDGTIGTLVNSYANRNEAEQKYHTILSAASVSEVFKHSAVMLDEDGVFIKSECYRHGEDNENN